MAVEISSRGECRHTIIEFRTYNKTELEQMYIIYIYKDNTEQFNTYAFVLFMFLSAYVTIEDEGIKDIGNGRMEYRLKLSAFHKHAVNKFDHRACGFDGNYNMSSFIIDFR